MISRFKFQPFVLICFQQDTYLFLSLSLSLSVFSHLFHHFDGDLIQTQICLNNFPFQSILLIFHVSYPLSLSCFHFKFPISDPTLHCIVR
ncbi:hypothetical protein QVD17_07678 [Tagetes erecta]|uniref:Uncharacterized protein n=1 Tax=Tagetes erecta TaxID=13708 RepID=A0AAD8PD16_TARER|nr:hypothetical protein QVD17_07678 [Tagetes erecta]